MLSYTFNTCSATANRGLTDIEDLEVTIERAAGDEAAFSGLALQLTSGPSLNISL